MNPAFAGKAHCWDGVPSGARIAMVSGSEIVAKFGKDSISLLNTKLVEYAKKANADLVVQSAVYVAPGFNKTDDFTNFYSQPDAPVQPLQPATIGFISRDTLFRSSVLKRLRETLSNDEAVRTFVGIANEAIKSVATAEKISLVFQVAVWANPACDMTEMVANEISRSVH